MMILFMEVLSSALEMHTHKGGLGSKSGQMENLGGSKGAIEALLIQWSSGSHQTLLEAMETERFPSKQC